MNVVDENYFECVDDDEPRYKPLSEIDQSAITQALCGLHLLGDDPYLHMQAMNIGIVDPFIANMEIKLLRKLIDEEGTPTPDALFVQAQSQMWMFAVYELLRTWRERANNIIKWHKNGGLELKLKSYDEDDGGLHFGRAIRARQIQKIINNPALIADICNDLRRTHVQFTQLEVLRISLAKHEVWHRKKSVALTPGYGRINNECGALDYELENGQYSMGYLNRRDVADSIRALLEGDAPPTDENLASFDEYMRGPPSEKNK